MSFVSDLITINELLISHQVNYTQERQFEIGYINRWELSGISKKKRYVVGGLIYCGCVREDGMVDEHTRKGAQVGPSMDNPCEKSSFDRPSIIPVSLNRHRFWGFSQPKCHYDDSIKRKSIEIEYERKRNELTRKIEVDYARVHSKGQNFNLSHHE